MKTKELYQELHKSIDEMRRQRDEVIEQLSSLQKQFEHLYNLREEELTLKDADYKELHKLIDEMRRQRDEVIGHLSKQKATALIQLIERRLQKTWEQSKTKQ